MMTDPIADMLTRIRNAIQIERPFVDVPYSNLKKGIAQALEREGYIWDFQVVEDEDRPQKVLRVNLKYGPNGERVIQHIKRLSKPGNRVYRKLDELAEVLDGLGINILSTSKGVLSNREARREHVGGEVICEVW
ncbi:MAG: 30S ribosomal protein S8 [Planctomycetaceae bacterium]|nr:30S ribosomal protein S8 [Planctomycetaceae bacterium]